MKALKIVFTGGGTGGHIFPAVAIANALKSQYPETEIQFVGALGKMEMQRVPEAGYPILGLPVRGLIRSFSLKNIRIIIDAIRSYQKAKSFLNSFQANLVIGTGGYASLPVCLAASKMNIPLFIWEGNSFAGLTNKLLRKSAKRIYCGFDGMNSQFPNGNWIHSGNPIRRELLSGVNTNDALAYFNFKEKTPCVFITGGSLGAKSINEAAEMSIEAWLKKGYSIIWQTGTNYVSNRNHPRLYCNPFISEMKYAYHLADVVVSRSGALSVSEIMACGVPAIFCPSPNVTDDHQTKNALKAVESKGAILITDAQIRRDLQTEVCRLLDDVHTLEAMKNYLLEAAKPNATSEIAADILNHI